jgi:hypothetical protein
MSVTYTITISEAENKALGAVAYSQQDWIENLVRARCISAMEEIVSSEVQRMFAEGKPITGTKEDIVLAADIESAAAREDRLQAELAELENQG